MGECAGKRLSKEGRPHSPTVGRQNPPHVPWQTKLESLKGVEYKRDEVSNKEVWGNRTMKHLFSIGMLCGVLITAAVTYVFAIPANSTYWQTEIWKRGGAAWTADKNGRIGWKWMVEPISDAPRAKPVIVPSSQTNVRSEKL